MKRATSLHAGAWRKLVKSRTVIPSDPDHDVVWLEVWMGPHHRKGSLAEPREVLPAEVHHPGGVAGGEGDGPRASRRSKCARSVSAGTGAEVPWAVIS